MFTRRKFLATLASLVVALSAATLYGQASTHGKGGKRDVEATGDSNAIWANPSAMKKGSEIRLRCRWGTEEIVDADNMIVVCKSYLLPSMKEKDVDNKTEWNGHTIKPPIRMWITGLPTGDIHDAGGGEFTITATVAAPKDAIGTDGKHALIPHLVDCKVFRIPVRPPDLPQVIRNGPNKAK